MESASRLMGICGILLAWAVVVTGCVATPPEQRLRDSVEALHDALEARDGAGMQEWIAEDFIGPEGMDRVAAKRLAQVMFLRHRHLRIALGPKQVTMLPGHATVRFSAAIAGGSGVLMPDSARLYDVETGWRLEDGDWRLTSASWEPRL